MKLQQRVVTVPAKWLLLLTLFLIVLGLLIDRERSLGGIAWSFVTAYGMYLFGTWFIAPYLLPLRNDPGASARARDLFNQFANGQKIGLAIVRDGKVEPKSDGKPRENVRGEGILIVDSTSVVPLFKDTGSSRLVGPGVHFLRKGEKFTRVIDLRPQARSLEDKEKDKGAQFVKVQTRDGICVKFKIATRFQIDGVIPRNVLEIDQGKMPLPEPYVWSQHIVRRAIGHTRFGADNKPAMPWDLLVLTEAVKRVHTYIADYRFDELAEPRNPLLNPREDIRKKLEEELKAEMAREGIKVLSLKIGPFEPCDEEVGKQRLRSWEAEWVRRTKVIEAEAEAESRKRLELARAQAQMDTMTRMIEALDASRRAGANNADLIALRFLEVVEGLAKDPETQKTLRHVRGQLLGEKTDGAAASAKS
ncbi:MAG TPA: SPFH domain-containing protein [Anaerolineae bacterium]|nr:SPFH domain-containing protein [Anaerolineae bacterium]